MQYLLSKKRQDLLILYVGNVHMNGTDHFSVLLSTNNLNKLTLLSSGCGYPLFFVHGRHVIN